jgi:hypothetical protein
MSVTAPAPPAHDEGGSVKMWNRLAVAALAVLGLVVGATAAHASTEPGYYQVINHQTGECLDVWDAATDHAAPVGVWRCVGADNQQWAPVYLDDGYYEVRVLHTGMCLDVAYASYTAGAQVVQGTCWGGENQQWRLVYVGDGYYQFIARHSGMCLDKTGSGSVVQWGCGNKWWQEWRLA